MKKILAVILLIAMLLAGCKPTAEAPAQPDLSTDPVTTPETESVKEEPAVTEPIPVPEVTQQPMIAVSMPFNSEYTYGDDGSTLFYYQYQDMHLTMQDPEVADQIILDMLNRIDQSRPEADSVKSQAQTDAADPYATFPYFYEIQYTPTRIDQSILSFYGTGYQYSGGNHPDHMCMAANYSLITGEVLTLGSLLTHEDSIAPLCQLVILELDKLADDMYLLDDYDQLVKQRFAKDASFDEDWYFTGTGLCFYFAPYEIAGYSSGTITVEIPYSLLTGIIADDYFPPEQDTATGTICAALHSDISVDQFTQIAEVPLDQGGEMVFIYTEGAVRDLRIESGYWNTDGTYFTVESTVFATYALTPGDAVMLETFIPDGMPNLQISYTANGEQITKYISQSGVDGSIILL